MRSILITGSQGFIGGYLCREFLEAGYRVIGVDNYSKYGIVRRDYDSHENFIFKNIDLTKDNSCAALSSLILKYHIKDVIAGAAMIGGISYFHKYA